jgi:hypothetical protein
MPGRFIVLVVAAIGWLFASLFAFAIVTLFGFFGVGFFGLLILFICTQVELDSDAGARLFGARAQARQNMGVRNVPPGVMSSRRTARPPVSSETLESD